MNRNHSFILQTKDFGLTCGFKTLNGSHTEHVVISDVDKQYTDNGDWNKQPRIGHSDHNNHAHHKQQTLETKNKKWTKSIPNYPEDYDVTNWNDVDL